jgi:hypothetical protein
VRSWTELGSSVRHTGNALAAVLSDASLPGMKIISVPICFSIATTLYMGHLSVLQKSPFNLICLY